MPYDKGATPKPLEGKGIPQKYVDVFIEVFNASYEKSPDEGEAHAKAFGAMVKALYRAGYRQARDKTWRMTSQKLEEAGLEFVPLSLQRNIVIENDSLEDAFANGMRFQGVAFVDYAVSQQGSGHERYYSPGFNDQVLQRTREYMAAGHKVTIYNTHASALGDWFSGADADPLGKVTDLWREGDEIRYRGFISATDEGQRLIRLVHDGVRDETSVRIYEYRAAERKLHSEKSDWTDIVYEMQDGYVGGIDFCDQAGIPGAGIVNVLESAPHFQEEIMEITLDLLKEQYPEIVNTIIAENLGVLNATISDLQAKVSEAQTQLSEAQTKLDEEKPVDEESTRAIEALQDKIVSLEEGIAGLQYDLALERAAQGLLGQEVVRLLREEKPADPATRAKELRDEALARVQAESHPGKGQAMEPPQPKTTPDPDFGGIAAEVLRNAQRRN